MISTFGCPAERGGFLGGRPVEQVSTLILRSGSVCTHHVIIFIKLVNTVLYLCPRSLAATPRRRTRWLCVCLVQVSSLW